MQLQSQLDLCLILVRGFGLCTVRWSTTRYLYRLNCDVDMRADRLQPGKSGAVVLIIAENCPPGQFSAEINRRPSLAIQGSLRHTCEGLGVEASGIAGG